MSKFCLIAGLLLQATLLVHGQNTVAAFAEKAYAVLPVEEPYTFHKELSEWREPLRRDAGARPGVSEMPVGPRGWRLLVRNDSGLVLRTAAEEFSEYLERSMQVKVALEHPASMAEWNNERNAIIAGTREQLPGCGESLKGPKDYRIAVSPGRIIVCGYDERGAMYGLFDIERRMNLREAPFLERTLDITRHSLFKARMVLSGLGWEEWPDRYLALLARYGFDSIFASVYVNPNGVPGPPPYWDRMKKQDPKRVHDLIRRAARYGIELYCPIIYLYTGEPENEAGDRKSVV